MHRRRITVADGAIAAILLLNLLFILTCSGRMEAYGADSSYYIGLAQSLGETGKYEFNAIPHTKYPPGLPAILHLSTKFFGLEGFSDYIRLIGFFSILAAAATYAYLRLHNSTYAFIITLLLLSSPWFFQLSTMVVLSEMPYLLSSMVALSSAYLLVRAPPGQRWPLSLLLCVSTTASLLLRSAALALPAGFLLFVLFSFCTAREHARKNLLLLPAICAGLLVFLLWSSWSAAHRVSFYDGQYMDSYLAQMLMKDPHIPDLGLASLGDILLRFKDNIGRIFADLSQLGLNYPYIGAFFYSPAVVLPLFLLGAGVYALLQQYGNSIAAWYLLCYIGIFAIWPFQEGPRFILPIFPIAALFVFAGADFVWRQAQSHVKRYAPYALFATLFFMSAGFADLVMSTAGIGRQQLLSVAFWAAAAVFCAAAWKNIRFSTGFFNTSAAAIKKLGRGLLWASFVAIVLGGYFQQAVFAAFNRDPDPKRFPHYRSVEASGWIADNVSEEAIVMAEQLAVVHRLTGNRVIPFPVTKDVRLINSVISRYDVDYLIVINDDDYTYFHPTQEQRFEVLASNYPGLFIPVHSNEDFRILRIVDHDGASNLVK